MSINIYDLLPEKSPCVCPLQCCCDEIEDILRGLLPKHFDDVKDALESIADPVEYYARLACVLFHREIIAKAKPSCCGDNFQKIFFALQYTVMNRNLDDMPSPRACFTAMRELAELLNEKLDSLGSRNIISLDDFIAEVFSCNSNVAQCLEHRECDMASNGTNREEYSNEDETFQQSNSGLVLDQIVKEEMEDEKGTSWPSSFLPQLPSTSVSNDYSVICTQEDVKEDYHEIKSNNLVYKTQVGVKALSKAKSRMQQNGSGFSPIMSKRSRYKIVEGQLLGPDDWADFPDVTARNSEQYFGDDVDPLKSVELLARYRLIANEVKCSSCPNNLALVKATNRSDVMLWRCNVCRKEGGSHRISLRRESFFAHSRLPLSKILHLAARWAADPTQKLDGVARDLQINKCTVGEFYESFRDICQSWLEMTATHQQLGGKGKVVEVIGLRCLKDRQLRGKPAQREYEWSFGMREMVSGNMAIFKVQERDAASLMLLVAHHIADGTMVVSDDWDSYGGFADFQTEFERQFPANDVTFVQASDAILAISGNDTTWISLRRSVMHLYSSIDTNWESYIFEYIFRRRHKTKIFGHLMATIGRITRF